MVYKVYSGKHYIKLIRENPEVSADYENDPILSKWVNPYYLKRNVIDSIRESSQAKPHFTYAVLDNFFNEDVLDAYFEEHKKLDFYPDDPNLPYDSNVVYAEEGKSEGSELFYYKPWQLLIAEYTGTVLTQAGEKTGVKQRAHAGDSKGFWIHTDRTEQKDAAMALLVYLNKNWKEEEGSMLQLWARIGHSESIDVEFSWKEFGDQQLDFLNERYSLTTDLVTSKGLEPAEVFLIDQITPEYNRIVVADFMRDPSYHSITPGNGRERFAIVQWLF